MKRSEIISKTFMITSQVNSGGQKRKNKQKK